MINLFVYLSVLTFGFFFFIWERKTWPNALIKMFFGVMMVFGIIVATYLSGYIIKVN